jgi:hypothetical protein
LVEPPPATPDPVAHRDPGAYRDAAADEREMRLDAENKHVEHLDTGEDDPNRYANP